MVLLASTVTVPVTSNSSLCTAVVVAPKLVATALLANVIPAA